MLEWILVAATMILFWAGVSVHELGHAYACRCVNVPVKEICLLGWRLPGHSGFTLPIQSRAFPEARWVIHLLPIGAYMVPDEARMKEVTRKARVYVLAMGPIASFLYGFVLAALGCAALAARGSIDECVWCRGEERTFVEGVPQSLAIALSAVLLALACVLLFIRRAWLTHAFLLFLGIVLMPSFFWIFYEMLREAFEAIKPFHEIFPGPFALTFMVKDFISANVKELTHPVLQCSALVLLMAGGLSVFIGWVNLIPLIAGDGTMIVMEYVPKIVATAIWRFTVGLIIALLALGIVGDVLWMGSRWNA